MQKTYANESREQFRERRHESRTERFRELFDAAQGALIERRGFDLADHTLAAARLVGALDGRATVRAAAAQVDEYDYHPNALAFLQSVARAVPPEPREEGAVWLVAVDLAGSQQAAREQFRRSLATIETCGVYDDYLPSKVAEPVYTLGENFEDSPLHEMYEKRVRQDRSLQVIIYARDNATGTGKTTLAVGLCKKWGNNWTAGNATNRPGEYRDMLNNKPEGSVLLADEIGQMFDARRSMSKENVEVSQDWQMIRKKRYRTLSTLPGPSFLDKRFKKLSDVMIVCTRRGHGRVYESKSDDEDGTLWREHMCNIEWGPLDDDEDYQEIEQMKLDRLKERFEGGADDEPELTQADLDAVASETRNDLLRSVYNDTDLTQQQLADAVGLSRSRIADILTE